MTQTVRVYGYHGTSTEAASLIIQQGFNISSNDYDWLGTGVYFFQDAPARAWEWANQQYPTNPAVIRSSIQLENCIDLLDIQWFPTIRNVYSLFIEDYRQSNRSFPKQNPEKSKAHRLDCAYFNYIIVEVLAQGGQRIDAIRAVFLEGERVYPSSAIFDRAHVQIAIRNTALIEESCLINIQGEI